MYESYIKKIQTYMDTCLYFPASKWPKYIMEERSYSRWAVTEVQSTLIRLLELTDLEQIYTECKPVLVIIQELADKFDELYEYGFTKDRRELAVHTTSDIVFLTGKKALQDLYEYLSDKGEHI